MPDRGLCQPGRGGGGLGHRTSPNHDWARLGGVSAALGSGFPKERGSDLGGGTSASSSQLHPVPPHPAPLLQEEAQEREAKEQECWVRLQDSCHLASPGSPLAGPTQGSSRNTLTFRQP